MGQVSLCQVSLTLVSFNAIISNLMYGEFDRGNCALSDIYAAMLHASLSFGWLAYLEVGEVVGSVEGNRLPDRYNIHKTTKE